jgi:putative ABC transport system substrate-binding protein
VGDPIASGFVAKLNQPGASITGFALYEASLGGKWLELLSEIDSRLKRAAIMFNPDTVTALVYMPSFETAARSPKVAPIIAHVHNDVEIETAIIALGLEPGGGLMCLPDGGFTIAHRSYRPRAETTYRQSIGGLLSYGPDQIDTWRLAASYADRILRGEKPVELPVQFPTKFEMVLNL